jgi:hypothetical protein
MGEYAVPAAALALGEQVPGYAVGASVPAESLFLTAGDFSWRFEFDVPAADLILGGLAPAFARGLRVPAASLTLTPLAPFSLPARIPVVGLTLTPLSPDGRARSQPGAIPLTLTALSPIFGRSYYPPTISLALVEQAPFFLRNPPGNAILRTVFRVYLTAPGEPDLELPARSFQARNRLTTRNYLAVVVPDPLPYIDAIQQRSSGRLVVKTGFALADGTETLQEIASGVFSDFRYDLGPFNGSATLVGYDYRAPRPPIARPMRGINFRGMNNSGARRFRCELDMYLQPGDTAELGDGESIVVDQVSYVISARQAVMEISEAEPSG